MKTLQRIKNDWAQDQGYEDWNELRKELYGDITPLKIESYMNEICIIAQKEALEKAAENAEVHRLNLVNGDKFTGKNVVSMPSERMKFSVDRFSITNPENLII